MRRRWTKADKLLFLAYAGILLCWVYLSNIYQDCISFQAFLFPAFAIFFVASALIRNFGARKSVLLGIGLAVFLECAALYAFLPADTYAEGRARMEERWLGEYEDVELMEGTRDFIGFFTGYDSQTFAERFFNRITGRSEEPLVRRRPYVYIFGADRDIVACVYDPFDGGSHIAVWEGLRRSDDWKRTLAMGGYTWMEE